jgi:hypothetical protein
MVASGVLVLGTPVFKNMYLPEVDLNAAGAAEHY